MNKILALDQSLSNTGYAIFVGNRFYESGHFPTKIKDSKCNVCNSERLYIIKEQISQLFNEYSGFDYVIIEGYSYTSNSQALSGLYELGGIIKLLCYENNSKLIIIPPSLAKKWLNMNDKFKEGKESGMTNKEVTYTAIKVKYNKYDFKSDDEADAFNFGYIMKEYFKFIKIPDNYNQVEKDVLIQLSEQLKVIDNCKGNHYHFDISESI